MGRPLAARRKSLLGYLARRAATSLKKTLPQSRARQPRRRNPQHIPRGLDFVRQHRPRIDSSEQTTDRRSRPCASEKRSPAQHISRKADRSSWSSGSIVQDTHACSKRCTSCKREGSSLFYSRQRPLAMVLPCSDQGRRKPVQQNCQLELEGSE